MLGNEGSIVFHINIYLVDCVGQFQLVTFWDKYDEAMAAIINIRWQQRDGSFFIRLVASKSKVGSIWNVGTTRMELN